MLAPLVLELTLSLRRNPVPYLLAVAMTFEGQLREYLRGIAPSAPHLAGLGASKEQIEDFVNIMASAPERLLLERPDQTRH